MGAILTRFLGARKERTNEAKYVLDSGRCEIKVGYFLVQSCAEYFHMNECFLSRLACTC